MEIDKKYGITLLFLGFIIIIDGSFSMVLVKDKRLLFQIGRFARTIIGLVIGIMGAELSS